MEIKKARGVYGWLWISPIFTIPTLIFIAFNSPGWEILCGGTYSGCDRSLANLLDGAIAVLGSALWHLLLVPNLLNRKSAFVRGHGVQALLLAGLRTAMALLTVYSTELSYSNTVWLVLGLILIWIFGTTISQSQAARGDGIVLRWLGHTNLLESIQAEIAQEAQQETRTPDELVKVVRFSLDPQARALAKPTRSQPRPLKTHRPRSIIRQPQIIIGPGTLKKPPKNSAFPWPITERTPRP